MTTRTMIIFNLFLFVLKTMANFRKETWKFGKNIKCVCGGEIIKVTDIKTRY